VDFAGGVLSLCALEVVTEGWMECRQGSPSRGVGNMEGLGNRDGWTET